MVVVVVVGGWKNEVVTYEFGERLPSGVTFGCTAPSSRTTGALDDVAWGVADVELRSK